MINQANNNQESRDRLVQLPPGRYLMAEKTGFLKLEKSHTGLLVENIGDSHRLVLVNDKLVIL